MMLLGKALDHQGKRLGPGIRIEAKFDKFSVEDTHPAATTQVTLHSRLLVPQLHDGRPAVQDGQGIPKSLVRPQRLR